MEVQQYKVVGQGRLTARRLKRGEILKHLTRSGEPNGMFMARCPACNALQPWGGDIVGPDEAPTVTRELICDCTRCLFAFRISAGRVVELDAPPEREKPKLSDEMRAVGVRYASEK